MINHVRVKHQHAAIPEGGLPALEIGKMRVNLRALSVGERPGPWFYRNVDVIKVDDPRKGHLLVPEAQREGREGRPQKECPTRVGQHAFMGRTPATRGRPTRETFLKSMQF